jgi:pyruvate dehydrogenase E2 component (dihydrolipoamide acetyltransferase)
MDEGTFVEWLKREGEPVKPGDPLFVLESDKATENIEALDAGRLQLTPASPKARDKVKVGQVLAYLLAEGEPVVARSEDPVVARSPDRATPRTEGLPAAAHQGRPSAPSVARSGHRATTRISPRARRVARELSIDWSTLQGSGRKGRIRERDVRAAAKTGSAGRLIPHTTARKIIAARMVAGVTQAAPVTLTTKADATNLVNLRGQFKSAANAPDEVPSYTDLVVKLTAAALRQHPLLQGQWREEGLFVPDRIDIAVAVAVEAGLVAPVIRGVDHLTLRQVVEQARDLVARARAGKLPADQLRDATFTVSNLGMFGVDAFTPILSLPQSAVLGVGRIVREPAVVADQIVPRDFVTLSLTFDHRVVDGAPAARFLDTLRRCIEQPAPWLVP